MNEDCAWLTVLHDLMKEENPIAYAVYTWTVTVYIGMTVHFPIPSPSWVALTLVFELYALHHCWQLDVCVPY